MSKVNVIVIAGQSNALGISRSKELPQEKQREYKTKIYFNTNTPHPFSKKWLNVRPGFGHARDELFGLELPVASYLENINEEYVIVKYASDGTCLYEKWSKQKNGDDWLGLTQTLKEAIEALQSQGKQIEFAGLLWQQGCSDAIEQEKAEKYEENLKSFIFSIRALTDEKMPVAIGSVHPVHPIMKYATQVIEAQKKTANDLENVYFVSTDGIEEVFDGWHYTPACEWELGKRLLNAIMEKKQ